jgi:dTDP-4-dehydrorhamnose reductase
VKAVITGAAGQLGRALARSVPSDVEASCMERTDLDVTNDGAVAALLDSLCPNVLLNAAAYTAVDRAESDPARAFEINAQAVASLAKRCAERNIKLVHVSTDFVFDGSLGRPYRPDDATHPLNVYGQSKLLGEQHIRAQPGLDWRIVRTSWVYAAEGRNFVLTMLKLLKERSVVRVVADQIGTPTSAASLAGCVWRAAHDSGASAVLHFSDAGVASWYDFAMAIYEEARAAGLLRRDVQILPIGADEYPTPATRPSYGVLEKRATLERLQVEPIHWRAALRSVVRQVRL